MISPLTILVGDVREKLKDLPDESVNCVVTSHRNSKGQFRNGTHWRPSKPWWNKEWLSEQYLTLKKSAQDIATEWKCGANNILFWLKKHKIQTRSISETRKIKRWGSFGEANPMFGRKGASNPNWRGGLTPARQRLYSRSEWKTIARKVRARDKCCRLCGSKESAHIHHIDPFHRCPLLGLDIGNLILLCVQCHGKIKHKELRWRRKLFKLINEERR